MGIQNGSRAAAMIPASMGDDVTKFKPLGDYVLVDPIPVNETAGGIALPEGREESKGRGRVIAVGPGTRDMNGNLIPNNVEPGDIVLVFGSLHSPPVPIRFGNKDYILTRVRDLCARFA